MSSYEKAELKRAELIQKFRMFGQPYQSVGIRRAGEDFVVVIRCSDKETALEIRSYVGDDEDVGITVGRARQLTY